MKLLHVISSVNPAGGGVIEGVRQLCSQYPHFGVYAEIACLDSPQSPWLQQSGLPKIHALGGGSSGYSYSSHLVPWLKNNAKSYDAVIIDGLWQYHSFAVWRALGGSNTPYYVFTHGMLGPWFKKKYPLKHAKKWLYWPWAEYRVLRDATNVLFTCEEERRLAGKSFWLYQAMEQVAGFGTSDPPSNIQQLKQEFEALYPEIVGKRVILYLGRLHLIKGCDLLLKAFASVVSDHPDLHLVMAGPDTNGLADTLKNLAYRLGVDARVTWTGMLSGDDKWGAISAADVFCLPSHHENFGVVVAEALACGKPVLISNKVNIWREIEADKAGFIAEDNLEGTTANLVRWLAMSTTERELMIERSRLCFFSRFHIQRAAQRLVTIIEENRQ